MDRVKPPCTVFAYEAEGYPSCCSDCDHEYTCPVLFYKTEADVEENVEKDNAGDIPKVRIDGLVGSDSDYERVFVSYRDMS